MVLPTHYCLVISMVKAPLTIDGQNLLKDGNKNNAISFKVARNGLKGLKVPTLISYNSQSYSNAI